MYISKKTDTGKTVHAYVCTYTNIHIQSHKYKGIEKEDVLINCIFVLKWKIMIWFLVYTFYHRNLILFLYPWFYVDLRGGLSKI